MRASIAVLWLAVSSPASVAQEGATTVMNELSQRFQRLESLLETGELETFAAMARGRPALERRLSELASIESPDAQAAVRARELTELFDDAAHWASQRKFAETQQAFADLRAACVSCHLTFRTGNESRSTFPATGNSVTGTIRLRDADGKERADRGWVLVFLESATAHAPPQPLRGNARISQRDRQFHPRVLAVTAGTVVEFPNDDTIFHNVFSLSKTSPFDLGVYEPGHSASVTMQRTGLVRVYCNIHPEMTASIVVLANRWHALSDGAGRYVITGVPDGEYTLRAWNDMGAESRQPLELHGGAVVRPSIELNETRRALTHLDKFGKPYSGDYR
jgi:plastocyanin